jgi:hypothetical protein
MNRVQILLPEEDDRQLERLSAKRKVSKSALVRRALKLLFRAESEEPEPLLRLIGQAGRVGRSDAGRRHDSILAAAERSRSRRRSS